MAEIDLFENPELIPKKVQSILDRYYEEFGEDMEYSDTERMQKEVESEGYTFDFGLDNVPYNLHKKETLKTGGEIKTKSSMTDKEKEKLTRISRLLDNNQVNDPELRAKLQAERDMLEEKAGKSTPAPKPELKAKKEKKAPVKKESPKKETLETKPKKKGETVMEYAKRTRKAGESWNNAVARASKEVKNGGKPVAKKIKKTVKKAKPVAKKIKRTKVKAKPVAKKIKKTSKKVKTPKVPRTIKRVKYLTGSTSKGIDKQVGAMPPGKRISKSKKTYYEYRANRADLNAKKKL